VDRTTRRYHRPGGAHGCWSCAATGQGGLKVRRPSSRVSGRTRPTTPTRRPTAVGSTPERREALMKAAGESRHQHFTDRSRALFRRINWSSAWNNRHRRAATYASILQVLKYRGYVKLDKKTDCGRGQGPRRGFGVPGKIPARYVGTILPVAEEQLDKISNKKSLAAWCWRTSGVTSSAPSRDQGQRSQGARCIDRAWSGPTSYAPREDGGRRARRGTNAARQAQLKAGKFGRLVGGTNYPECRYPGPLAADSEARADRISQGSGEKI